MHELRPGRTVLPILLLGAASLVTAACDDEPVAPALQVATLQLALEDTLRVSGQTTRVEAVALSDGGEPVEGAALEMESSDPGVADVDPDGTVRALAGGGAWLRAWVMANPSVRDSVHLTVKQAGTVRWVAQGVRAGGGRWDAVALGPGGNLYVRGGLPEGVVSVDPAGSPRWATELGDTGHYLTPLMVREDGVVVVPDGTSWALDPGSGTVLWSTDVTSTTGEGPVALAADGGCSRSWIPAPAPRRVRTSAGSPPREIWAGTSPTVATWAAPSASPWVPAAR